MKIALIKCGGSLNVGNEFICVGGKQLVKNVFPDADFYEFEFFDSCNELAYTYPSEILLKNDVEFINSECDLAFIFSGSIISEYAKTTLDKLSKLECKKVLLGASAFLYDEFEKNLALELSQKFDYIFTRDDITYSYFNGAKNVFSGIDLGFFTKELINGTDVRGDYAVINVDLIKDYADFIEEIKTELRETFGYETIYVVENTATKYANVKDFLYIGYWDTLFQVYSKASFVITNRIHTSLACVCCQTPFRYVGDDHSSRIGRNSLFSKIGFVLEQNKIHSTTELSELSDTIEQQKSNMVNLLKKVFEA